MAYEMKPNTGSLFKNDKKEAETHPDYKGSALIDGLGECWLDAWINESANGTKYMSLKIKPKDGARPSSVADPGRSLPATSAPADATDSIPF